MIRYVFIAAAYLALTPPICVPAIAQEGTDKLCAEISYRGEEDAAEKVDLHSMPVGKISERRVRILNLTGDSLVLDRADVSCGCVRVHAEDKEFAAGGAMDLTLAIAPSTATDDFKQEVRLVFDNGMHALKFYVFGKTYGKVRLVPMRLRFESPGATKIIRLTIDDPALRYDRVEFGRGALRLVEADRKDAQNIELTCSLANNAQQAVEHVRVFLKPEKAADQTGLVTTDFLVSTSLNASWQCVPSQLYWGNKTSTMAIRNTIVFTGKNVPKKAVVPEVQMVFADPHKVVNGEECPLRVSRSGQRVFVLSRRTGKDLGPAPKSISIRFPGTLVSIPVIGEE